MAKKVFFILHLACHRRLLTCLCMLRVTSTLIWTDYVELYNFSCFSLLLCHLCFIFFFICYTYYCVLLQLCLFLFVIMCWFLLLSTCRNCFLIVIRPGYSLCCLAASVARHIRRQPKSSPAMLCPSLTVCDETDAVSHSGKFLYQQNKCLLQR